MQVPASLVSAAYSDRRNALFTSPESALASSSTGFRRNTGRFLANGIRRFRSMAKNERANSKSGTRSRTSMRRDTAVFWLNFRYSMPLTTHTRAMRLLEAAGEDTKMAAHLSLGFRPAFPSSAIISERSSPSRVRFAAPNNGAPLTASGRSEQRLLIRGKGSLRTALPAGCQFAAILVPFSTATDMRRSVSKQSPGGTM